MTIDDILEENAEMREKIKCLEDVIAHNMTQMAEMIQRNIESIDINKYNIDQNKADTDNNITNLTKDINDNKNTIEQTNGSHQTSDIPDGWVRCDGAIIPSGSIWAGQHTPDLNSARRFLRGGTDSDALKMEGHQMQQHKHNVYDPGHTHDFKDSFASRDGNQGTGIFSNAIQPHDRTADHGRTNRQVSQLFKTHERK